MVAGPPPPAGLWLILLASWHVRRWGGKAAPQPAIVGCKVRLARESRKELGSVLGLLRRLGMNDERHQRTQSPSESTQMVGKR